MSLKFFYISMLRNYIPSISYLVLLTRGNRQAKTSKITKEGLMEKENGIKEQKFSFLGVSFSRKAVDQQERENTHNIQGLIMV